MTHSLYSKIFALVVAGLCVSCSSPGQSVQKNPDVEKMSAQALSVGIESGTAMLAAFYVVNNTNSDISMLIWNTPFEKMLSADIFTVTRGDKAMPYLGRKVKRGSPGNTDYLMVPAGEKLTAAMDIATYYGATEPGKYTMTLKLPEIEGVTKLNQETVVAIESATLDFTVSN